MSAGSALKDGVTCIEFGNNVWMVPRGLGSPRDPFDSIARVPRAHGWSHSRTGSQLKSAAQWMICGPVSIPRNSGASAAGRNAPACRQDVAWQPAYAMRLVGPRGFVLLAGRARVIWLPPLPASKRRFTRARSFDCVPPMPVSRVAHGDAAACSGPSAHVDIVLAQTPAWESRLAPALHGVVISASIRLRAKLESDPRRPKALLTEAGVGNRSRTNDSTATEQG